MKPAVACLLFLLHRLQHCHLLPHCPTRSGYAALSVSALLCCAALPAQAVYKCTEKGAIIYSDQPCSGQTLPLPSLPGTSQKNSARDETLAREKAEIARLQKSREQRERQDQQIRDLYTRGAAARARKCSSLALQLRWREEDLREAVLKDAPKARVRARRAAEKYAMECK